MKYDIWQGWWHQRSLEVGSDTCVFQKKTTDISILTETHINHDQIHHRIHIRSNWLGPIFSSPEESHIKGSLVLLHLALEGITEVGTDPKREDCVLWGYSTTYNDRVLCVYSPSGYSTREQLARGRLLKRLKSFMENKNEWNENKTIVGDFNCTMDKMNRK